MAVESGPTAAAGTGIDGNPTLAYIARSITPSQALRGILNAIA